MKKMASSAVPINKVIAQRWSPRAYDADKTLTENEVLALIEAARWAPSCFGEEPWRFIVCDRAHYRSAWEKLRDCLTERNQLWARNVPLLLHKTRPILR